MPLDIKKLKKKTQLHWSDLWDQEKTRYENTVNILNKAIWLPDPDIQVPMVAVYIWLNSNWATQTPYLFSYGREGSGKSAIATIMEKMLDIACLQAASTPVSIRNEVNNSRFPEGEDGPENDCFFLVWDNVNIETLKDPKIWEILISGAIRGKDRVAVSSSIVGENKYFYTFCPKVYSSVWPLHANPDYRELTRRTMVLFHEKLSEEKLGEIDLTPTDELDFSDFFLVKMQPFFNSEQRYLDYVEFKKEWLWCTNKSIHIRGFSDQDPVKCPISSRFSA